MKKSIFLFFAAILCAMSAYAEMLYLKPSSNWKEADAIFYVWYWTGNGSGTAGKMQPVELGLYGFDIGNNDSFLITRNKPTSNGPWTDTWAQTGDLKYDSSKNCYLVINWNESGSGLIAKPSAHIAGDEGLLGVNWAPGEAANKMTKQDDGTYTLVKTVTLEAKTYLFKVTDGTWDWSLGDPNASNNDKNAELTISEAGEYNVTFTYNPTANTVSAAAEKVEAEEPETPVEPTPDPEPEPEPAETETVYFVNAEDWTGTIYAYAWTDGTPEVKNHDWPGVAATKEANKIGGHDVYSYTAEKGKYAKVIFNNNSGNQTSDKIWTADQYLCKNEWCADEAAVLAKLNGPIEYVSVYFINTVKWSAVNIYTWSPEVKTWPGVAMTKEAEQIGGFDVYSYTVEKGTTFGGMKFNENGGNQTGDLQWTDGKYYIYNYGEVVGWFTKEEAEAKLAAPVENVYTIAGAAALVGKEWDINAAENVMQAGSVDGEYTLIKTDMTIAKGTYEYKVVCNHDWNNAGQFPAQGNQSVKIEEDGIYTLTFTYIVGTELKVELQKTSGAEIETKYYVAGTLPGVEWNPTSFEMTANGKVYSAKFENVPAETYSFRITSGGWSPSWGYSHMDGSYSEISAGENDNNFSLTLTQTTTFTIIFDSENEKISFEGLTPVTIEPVTAYTVTVPAGTEKCYIVGEFAESNWNTFIEMDKVAGEDNKFTIEVGAGKKIAEATTVTKYKYARDTNWDNVEKDENGEEIGNRTWSDNDVVASWAAPAETHTYTVAGSATLFGEDWDNTINEMTLQDDGTYVWTATGVTLSESVEFKVIEDQNWDIAWPASNYVIEIGEDKANTPGTYDVNIYFNAAEAKADNTTGIYVQLTPATIEIAEYMDITMTNLQTEDYGGILALMGSEEVLGLSVQLFLNDYTGADKEYELNEASYLAMVSGWMETELPFVSGSMTKSTDATYGDKFAGTVIVYMDDKYIGLNITMYKKPLSKVDLTITGADVAIDLYNGVKITTTHDGKPVLVEFSSFEYLASNKYYDASLEMGDWETDDTYFRAFATEADVTISGNTLTLKGSFEAADAIYNLTISGTMPLVVTEGDNTNLLAQNGQTADAYITRTFESGNLYTVSFPFAMDESTTKSVFGSRVEVYEYTSLTEETDGLVLNFTKLSTPQIVAGTPYLVKPNRYAYGFGLSDVTISDANNPVTYTCAGTTIAMEPVLTVAANAKTNGKTQYWLAEDNNLYNKSVNLKGLRAIFNVQTNKSNVRARAAFNENVETGVEDIFSTDAPVKVIVNGQLIIIRDGEMYNVQGQLVK